MAKSVKKQKEEQKEIANSILNSVYSKLLSPDATTETILQMMLDADLDDGIRYLVGNLAIKLTENFINGKEINSQQYHKALEIIEDLDPESGPDLELFDEYTEKSYTLKCNSIDYPIRNCVVNMAVRKLKQECPNLNELFKILGELDLRAED